MSLKYYYEGILLTLQKRTYRTMVLKNHIAHFQDIEIGELPIVPICPGENVEGCERTEIFVGWKAEEVEIIGKKSGKKIKLESQDKRLWYSSELINEDIQVIVTLPTSDNNQNSETSENGAKIIEREFIFGNQFTKRSGYYILINYRDPSIIAVRVFKLF